MYIISDHAVKIITHNCSNNVKHATPDTGVFVSQVFKLNFSVSQSLIEFKFNTSTKAESKNVCSVVPALIGLYF